VVECQLPKLDVAGSSPVSRSTFQLELGHRPGRRSQSFVLRRVQVLVAGGCRSPSPPVARISRSQRSICKHRRKVRFGHWGFPVVVRISKK
jgi:hypothetical protein